MKSIKFLIAAVIIMWVAVACKQEFIGQYPVDSIAPVPVTNLKITPLAGGVHMTYDLPKESDLLYVSVTFKNQLGQQREERVSAFTSDITILGFGVEQDVEFTVTTVDRSMNVSEPIVVNAKVLRANIYNIIEDMKITPTWGGIKLEWTNENESDVIVSVTAPNAEGVYYEVGRFYSKSKSNIYYVRGMESQEIPFVITARDIYGNITPPRNEDLTPLFEQELPVEDFCTPGRTNLFALPPYIVKTGSSSDLHRVFENKAGQVDLSTASGYDVNECNIYEPYLAFDMLKVYKFSRFQMFGRINMEYTWRNARIVELWGTADLSVVEKGDENWDGWVCLGRYESVRPSGTDYTTSPTEADKEYGRTTGDNFDMLGDNLLPPGDGIPTETEVHARATTFSDIPVRYVRIRGLSNWSGVKNGMCIKHLQFWGREVTENE